MVGSRVSYTTRDSDNFPMNVGNSVLIKLNRTRDVETKYVQLDSASDYD